MPREIADVAYRANPEAIIFFFDSGYFDYISSYFAPQHDN